MDFWEGCLRSVCWTWCNYDGRAWGFWDRLDQLRTANWFLCGPVRIWAATIQLAAVAVIWVGGRVFLVHFFVRECVAHATTAEKILLAFLRLVLFLSLSHLFSSLYDEFSFVFDLTICVFSTTKKYLTFVKSREIERISCRCGRDDNRPFSQILRRRNTQELLWKQSVLYLFPPRTQLSTELQFT